MKHKRQSFSIYAGLTALAFNGLAYFFLQASNGTLISSTGFSESLSNGVGKGLVWFFSICLAMGGISMAIIAIVAGVYGISRHKSAVAMVGLLFGSAALYISWNVLRSF